MKFIFTERAWEDYLWFQAIHLKFECNMKFEFIGIDLGVFLSSFIYLKGIWECTHIADL